VIALSSGALSFDSAGSGGMRARTSIDTTCPTPTVTHDTIPSFITPADAGAPATITIEMTLRACVAPIGACADGDAAAPHGAGEMAAVAVAVGDGVGG
jgi:hypothetical protein